MCKKEHHNIDMYRVRASFGILESVSRVVQSQADQRGGGKGAAWWPVAELPRRQGPW